MHAEHNHAHANCPTKHEIAVWILKDKIIGFFDKNDKKATDPENYENYKKIEKGVEFTTNENKKFKIENVKIPDFLKEKNLTEKQKGIILHFSKMTLLNDAIVKPDDTNQGCKITMPIPDQEQLEWSLETAQKNYPDLFPIVI